MVGLLPKGKKKSNWCEMADGDVRHWFSGVLGHLREDAISLRLSSKRVLLSKDIIIRETH